MDGLILFPSLSDFPDIVCAPDSVEAMWVLRVWLMESLVEQTDIAGVVGYGCDSAGSSS